MMGVLDAEDRLNKATDDLKRVTEHIEQEKAINKEVQRRQVSEGSVCREWRERECNLDAITIIQSK